MLLRPYRRRPWRWAYRAILLFTTILALDLFSILSGHHTFRLNLLSQTLVSHEDLPHAVQQQKIFIAAQFWTSEDLLVNHWIDAFVRLVQVIGPENVYVSIISNHGLDNTEDAVRLLDHHLAELSVPRTVIIDPSTHEDALSATPQGSSTNEQSGWVSFTDDDNKTILKARRRIPYLSDIRNKALERLQILKYDSNIVFDRILFLNDVVFEPADILTLLATNGGDFDVACGLDYHQPPLLYDTFAMRDASYRGPITSVFPYFVSPATRKAMLAGLPAPVTSCWNGVIAVDAAPYYDHFSPSQSHREVQKGLRFRGILDSLAEFYIEASECCLIHADLLASGQAHRGMYINPAVRTAYVADAYNATHHGPLGSNFVSAWQYWSGIWVIRFRRWWKDAVSISAGQNMPEVYRRIRHWEQREQAESKEMPRMEAGGYCTILEMQILLPNGWKHISRTAAELKIK